MTHETSATLQLLRVQSRAEAIDWWHANPLAAADSTVIVAHEDVSNLVVPVHRVFGQRLHLLSIFSVPNLTVLNERIVEETRARGTANLAVDFNVAFDTNAASYLRSLFGGRNNQHVIDLIAFLQSFQGNKINWDVRCDLHENAGRLMAADRDVFDTVLASEKLAGLDGARFVGEGVIDFKESIGAMRIAACKSQSSRTN